MTTCDTCFDGRHVKCRDRQCGCTVCAANRTLSKPAGTTYRGRIGAEREKRTRVVTRTGTAKRNNFGPTGLTGMGEDPAVYAKQVLELLEHIAEDMGV